MTAADFKVGQAVQVYSFGCWYPGTVTDRGRTNVWVRYVTGGTTRLKSFKPYYVAPAGTFTGFRRGEPEPGSDEALAAIAAAEVSR